MRWLSRAAVRSVLVFGLALIAGGVSPNVLLGQGDGATSADLLMDEVKRLVASWQESFNETGRCIQTMESLPFAPSSRVSIEFVADSCAWMAVATSADGLAQCVFRYGHLPPDTPEPQNRVGDSAPGRIACVPRPTLSPSEEFATELGDLVNDANFRGSLYRISQAAAVTDSLQSVAQGALLQQPSERLDDWLEISMSFDSTWTASADWESLASRARAESELEELIGQLMTAIRGVRHAQQGLLVTFDSLRVSNAFSRYWPSARGPRQTVTGGELQGDDRLTAWFEGLALGWRNLRVAYILRQRSAIRLLGALNN